jgi:hypothetical protein
MTLRTPKLSKALVRELERTNAQHIIVAAVLAVKRGDLDRYGVLGLNWDQGRITSGPPVLPPPSLGIHARRNLEGWSDKRTDLPKEMREVSSYAPSWNSGAYHHVSRDILAYPLEHHPARLLTISATILEQLVDGALVRFRIDQPLDRNSQSFAADLQFNLRLLREAVGEAQIYDADLSDDDFARIQRVEWEMLPPGSGARVLERLASAGRSIPERLEIAGERLGVLDSLGHDGYIVGMGKFARYFGAKFGDRLVVLENLEYGNALYVFTENWEQLSQLSRTELIKRRDPAVQRIPHARGWRSALRKLITTVGVY